MSDKTEDIERLLDSDPEETTPTNKVEAMDTSTNNPEVTRKAEPESEVKDSSTIETKSPKEESTSANKTPVDTEQLKLRIKKFSSRSSDFKAAAAKGDSGCKLCSFMATGKDLADHTRQHFLRCYCICGYSTLTRRALMEHMRAKTDLHRHWRDYYEVDANHFERFKKEKDLPKDMTFGELLPTTTPPVAAAADVAVRESVKDIRLTMSEAQIKEDAKKIREERKLKRSGSKDRKKSTQKEKKKKTEKVEKKVVSPEPTQPVPSTSQVRTSAELMAEMERLRRENAALRTENAALSSALERVRGRLSQALGDCEIGQ